MDSPVPQARGADAAACGLLCFACDAVTDAETTSTAAVAGYGSFSGLAGVTKPLPVVSHHQCRRSLFARLLSSFSPPLKAGRETGWGERGCERGGAAGRRSHSGKEGRETNLPSKSLESRANTNVALKQHKIRWDKRVRAAGTWPWPLRRRGGTRQRYSGVLPPGWCSREHLCLRLVLAGLKLHHGVSTGSDEPRGRMPRVPGSRRRYKTRAGPGFTRVTRGGEN